MLESRLDFIEEKILPVFRGDTDGEWDDEESGGDSTVGPSFEEVSNSHEHAPVQFGPKTSVPAPGGIDPDLPYDPLEAGRIMKYLLAPASEVKGIGRLDFCFTIPEELLVVSPLLCYAGWPTDACGCRRAFTGIENSNGTTVGIVGNTSLSIGQIVERAIRRMIAGSEVTDDTQGEWREDLTWLVKMIADFSAELPDGTPVVLVVPDTIDTARLFIAPNTLYPDFARPAEIPDC
jgi:hypothetical protein